MRITNHSTDEAVLAELGHRLRRQRLDLDLTQARLAEESGVSKRTIERVEAGESTQLSKLLRILRGIGLLENLEVLAPTPQVSPMALLRHAGRQRKRASRQRTPTHTTGDWTWGEDT